MVKRCRFAVLVAAALSFFVCAPLGAGSASAASSFSSVLWQCPDGPPAFSLAFDGQLLYDAPAEVAQGTMFTVTAHFSIGSPISPLVYPVQSFDAALLRPSNVGGVDVHFTPPLSPLTLPADSRTITTTYSVWGAIGDMIEFRPGPFVADFGDNVKLTCNPIDGLPPLISIKIVAGNPNPITDEVGFDIRTTQGTQVFASRAFLDTGNTVFTRDASGGVIGIDGTGTFTDLATGDHMSVGFKTVSGAGPTPRVQVLLVDSAANRAWAGLVPISLKSSATRETAIGLSGVFGTGLSPFGSMSWFVRDLQRT